MKPLLMHRTKGITGPRFAKHASIPGLSKSVGNSIGGVYAQEGWAGPESCSSIDLTKVTVKFSGYVYYIVPAKGVLITHNSGGTFTITSTVGNGTPIIEYTGSWDKAPNPATIFQYSYSGGDYVDGSDQPIGDQLIPLVNCSGLTNWTDETGVEWEDELSAPWLTE